MNIFSIKKMLLSNYKIKMMMMHQNELKPLCTHSRQGLSQSHYGVFVSGSLEPSTLAPKGNFIQQ